MCIYISSVLCINSFGVYIYISSVLHINSSLLHLKGCLCGRFRWILEEKTHLSMCPESSLHWIALQLFHQQGGKNEVLSICWAGTRWAFKGSYDSMDIQLVCVIINCFWHAGLYNKFCKTQRMQNIWGHWSDTCTWSTNKFKCSEYPTIPGGRQDV